MKYLKSYKLFESNVGDKEFMDLESINDLLIDFIDDVDCSFIKRSDVFGFYEFQSNIKFSEAIDILIRWNVKNYVYDSDNKHIYVYDKSLDDFLVDKLSGCEIKDSKRYTGQYLIWKKDGYVYALQDLKNKEFYLDHDKIWLFFKSENHMENKEIQAFVSERLNDHFKLEDYTPHFRWLSEITWLIEHFKLGDYTPRVKQ